MMAAFLALGVYWVLHHQSSSAKRPEAYVVLVGISDYADKQIKPRVHAEEDVKALYDVFTDPRYLGVDADHIRLLLGGEDAGRKSQPASHANILAALNWMATNARTDDLTIFAFSGAGGSLGERGDRTCYFASDSTLRNRAQDAVAASEIGQELDPARFKSHRFCAFIDVNFKGYDPGAASIPEATLGNAPYQEFLASENNEEHTPAPGRLVFLATNGMSPSLDLDKHGVFAQVLVDGLKGGADRDGYEPDGLITVNELTEYLEKELPLQTRAHGKETIEKAQIPYVLGDKASHFELTHNPEVAATVRARLDKLAAMAREQKISDKLAEEGHGLLSRMPKLESQRTLRKAYQQLVDGTLTPEKLQEKRDTILADARLEPADALSYATKVINCTQTIRDVYVKEINQGEMVDWAIRGLYRRLEERIPDAISDRLAKVKGSNESELLQLLADARQVLGKREDLDNQNDLNYSLQRMLAHLDPYTTYYDAEAKKSLDQSLSGQFTGVGMQMRKDGATDALQVVTPIKGGPAYKAGLLSGDLISTITPEMDDNGEPLAQPESISTKGLALTDAVRKLGGAPGTKVKLTVERQGADRPLEFELTRAQVETETLVGLRRKSDDDWEFYADPERKIGYIRLTSFASNSYRDMAQVVNNLDKTGLKGLILDLRFNGGGTFDSSVKIADLFIDDGLIVTQRPRVGEATPFTGQHEGSYVNFVMVCLVNGRSASASEIVSSCLQDHSRAYIVGERTFGKGCLQTRYPFEGGMLQVTTATLSRPSGKNLNKSSTSGKETDEWGVIPDKVIELSPRERDDLAEYQRNAEIIPRRDLVTTDPKPGFTDRQLEAALDYLRGQI